MSPPCEETVVKLILVEILKKKKFYASYVAVWHVYSQTNFSKTLFNLNSEWYSKVL